MKISYCAILLWTLLSIMIIIPKIYGASINAKTLDVSDEKQHFANITRHYEGDIIFIKDVPNCNENTCLEVLGGSATIYNDQKASSKNNSSRCKCQCVKHLKTYREDEGFCVDTIRECPLIPFASSNTALDTFEKIPSVFLPLQGQIIYPSKELLFSDEYADAKCVLMGASYMTPLGWSDIKSHFQTNDVPFRLYVDKNRTFLQWQGDTSHRSFLQGRLIILRLACRDDSPDFQKISSSEEAPLKSIRNLSPCISFRVTGSLLKHKPNITEVQFALEPSDKEKESLTTNEYVIIAVTSFCLGLMYIASVFLYIYFKKKKDLVRSISSENSDKNFSRGEPDMHNSRSSYRRNSSLAPSIEFIDNPEAHVIKSNPLMKHFMSFNENNAFVSDSSDAESSIVRKDSHGNISDGSINDFSRNQSMSNEAECLPEEDVSITEDSDNRSDNNRQFQNGTARRKLYFNPAYFEPELLASPPPAAVEFLTKIREVISMAKGKMAAKRFQPMLNYIPEEGSLASDTYSPGTMKSAKSTISSRKNSSKDCAGCPGCIESKKLYENPQSLKNCKNCNGDKQKSIQKWLESVSNASNEISDNSVYNEKKSDKRPLISLPILNEDSDTIEAIEKVNENPPKSVNDEIQVVKGYVKEKNIFVQLDRNSSRYIDQAVDGGSIPKIISHSLKKNIKEMIYSQNFVRDKVNVFESKKSDVQKFDAAHEIYNNPKFNMNQEVEAPPSRPYSSVVKKKPEVLDQYSNPAKRDNLNGKSDENNLNQMPDMIYEAIEMEKKNKPIINYQSPTPDYSSEYEMTKFKKYDNVLFAPFVPTPDYHTYGKNTLKSLKHYQPDSPIYSRKSPAYLVVDYETDSLERLNTFKNRTAISTPTRSDFSSQPSPSALPMEEEVEIRNALYDREEGFRKDTDTIKKEREIDIQMRKTKIKYNTPSEGSMTIELEGVSPDENDDASSTNSDEFEPDTLDRHAKINKTVLEKIKMERKSFDGSSSNNSGENVLNTEKNEQIEMHDELGRILTLEVRHSKRQRNIGEASLKKLPNGHGKTDKPVNSIPPDVISSNKPLNDESQLIVKKPSSPTAFEINATRKTNQHILDEHDFKKSQISAPILTTIEMDNIPASKSKRGNKTLRGEFFKMDLLNLDTNFIQNQIGKEYEPSLIKTIYHVEIPTPPEFSKMKEEIYNSPNGKKTKDFKNAWKKFMGIASAKFKKYENSEDDDEEAQNSIQSVASEIKQGKVKDLIKKLNVVRADNCKLKEYDSGYLSAESLNNDISLTEVELKMDIEKNMKNLKARPQLPPPPPPPIIPVSNHKSNKNFHKKNFPISLINNNSYLNHEDLVNINIYSSDDDDDDDQDSSTYKSEHVDTCEDIGADSDFSFVN